MGHVVQAALNGGIAAAYILIAALIVPRLTVPRFARWAGIAFFLACSATHIDMMLHSLEHGESFLVEPHMFVIHGVQLVVDWTFLLYALHELRIDVRANRAAAEATFRDSEERHRAIVETAADAILTIDEDGRIESLNGAAERMFGHAQAAAAGQPVTMLIPEGDPADRYDRLRRRVEERAGETGGADASLHGRRADGTTFPVHLAMSRMVVGGRRRYVGIIRDLTEQVQAQEDVRRERDYARALVESMQDGVVVRDDRGVIVQVSARFCAMTGLAPDELVGTSAPFPYWPPDHDGPLDAVEALRAGKTELDTVFQRRDGSRFPVILAAAALTDADGNVTGHVLTVKDASERRRAEETRRALAVEQALAAEQAALRRLAVAVASGATPEDLFPVAAEEAARLLGAEVGGVVRVDAPERGTLVGQWAARPALVPPGTHVSLSGDTPTCVALRSGRPVRARDYHELTDPRSRRLVSLGYRSGLAAPVRARGRTWGALAVARTVHDPFPHDAEMRLERFADLVGLAVANAEIGRELAARVAEQAALRRVATAVASDATPRTVFALVAEQAATVLGAESAGIVQFGGDEGVVVGAWADGVATAPTGTRLPLRGNSPAAAVARTGRSARMDDLSALDRETAALLRVDDEFPFRSALAAPVRVDDDVWGAIVVARTQSEPLPAAAEDALLRFAELLGLAIVGADARAQLATLASTDHLTGLFNQRAFEERLHAEVERARRHRRNLSLVVLDLDFFKSVNDTHGHAVGNAVLAEVARRLRAMARGGETLARVGGEEFAWILPESDGMGAYTAAERARRAIEAEPFDVAGRLTVSAGVCDLADASGAGELFRLADVALYWAKAQGRNITFRYAPDVLELLSAKEQTQRLERARTLTAVRVLAQAVDAKDPSTQRHSERVADLARDLALAAGWSPEQAGLLHEAGLVHDVGKIAVPEHILFKPGPLLPDEYDQVKLHARLGAEMLSDVLSRDQVEWVRHHHERHDGTGYPDRVSGPGFSAGARMLALADSWDAMTAARPYGGVKSPEEAIAECRAQAGHQFCPAAVAALERLWAEGRLPSPTPDPAVVHAVE